MKKDIIECGDLIFNADTGMIRPAERKLGFKLIRAYIREALLENQLAGSLEIAGSPIHGAGIFAKGPIPAHMDLGPAQIKHSDGRYNITGLGKYHNHSSNPTCYNKMLGNVRHIFPHYDLKVGDEITVDYTLQPDLEQPKNDWA